MTNHLSFWTTESLETIKTLYYQGETYSAIGKAVGKGRNAIGGIIFRLREAGQMDRAAPRLYRPRVKPLHKPSKPVTVPKPPAAAWTLKSNPKHVQPPQNPEGRSRKPTAAGKGIPLADMADHQCKWSIGYTKTGTHLFCGAQTEGGPWCAAHAARATVKVQVRNDR